MKKSILILFFFGYLSANAQTDSLDIMIGQMIMIGIGDFNNPDPNQEVFDEIKEGKVGGVVYYEKNLTKENTRNNLSQLTIKLQRNSEIPLFISIDEEGGRVTRLKEKYGFPERVSAGYLGKINNLDSTKYYAEVISSLLSSLGITMNYAPVVDLNVNPENPVIGKIERSYSDNYAAVISHANQVIASHNENNVVTVLKHFPGHGSSTNDTHLGLTDVTKTWTFEEIYPYKALIDTGNVKAIMTAHIVNESLDRSKVPATLSSKVITGMLREFLGYEGLIISDDMQMGAIKNEYGIKDAVKMSINAGVDMVMFANNVQDYDLVTSSQIHALIRELVEEGEISQYRIAESYQRIMKIKNEFGLMDENYFKTLKGNLKSK